MIFTVSGASHSGKTTLIKEACKLIPNAVPHYEEIRSYKLDDIASLRSKPDDYFELQLDMILTRISTERSFITGGKSRDSSVLILDRNLLDNLFYVTTFIDVNSLKLINRKQYTTLVRLLSNMAVFNVNHYKRMFTLDPIPVNTIDPYVSKDMGANQQHGEYVTISRMVMDHAVKSGDPLKFVPLKHTESALDSFVNIILQDVAKHSVT